MELHFKQQHETKRNRKRAVLMSSNFSETIPLHANGLLSANDEHTYHALLDGGHEEGQARQVDQLRAALPPHLRAPEGIEHEQDGQRARR